jgi:hypothetical protein
MGAGVDLVRYPAKTIHPIAIKIIKRVEVFIANPRDILS